MRDMYTEVRRAVRLARWLQVVQASRTFIRSDVRAAVRGVFPGQAQYGIASRLATRAALVSIGIAPLRADESKVLWND